MHYSVCLKEHTLANTISFSFQILRSFYLYFLIQYILVRRRSIVVVGCCRVNTSFSFSFKLNKYSKKNKYWRNRLVFVCVYRYGWVTEVFILNVFQSPFSFPGKTKITNEIKYFWDSMKNEATFSFFRFSLCTFVIFAFQTDRNQRKRFRKRDRMQKY